MKPLCATVRRRRKSRRRERVLPVGQTKTLSAALPPFSLFHADPPPFLDWLESAKGVGKSPVPRASRANDAVVVRVGLAVALLPRLRRHRVGEGGNAVADGRIAHQLGVDDDPDAIVDVRVALVGIEAVKLRARDEVEDAFYAAERMALDVGVEPLHEPPALERRPSDWSGVGNALANPLGVHVRPVGEVEVGLGVHREAPRLV